MKIHWKAEVEGERDVNLDGTIFVSDAVAKCDREILTRGITSEMNYLVKDLAPLVVKAVQNNAANSDSSSDS